MLAYIGMVIVFCIEFMSAFTRETVTSMYLDTGRPDFQINLDVDMHHITCKSLIVELLDDREMPITMHGRDFMLTPLERTDHRSIHILGDDTDEVEQRFEEKKALAGLRATLAPGWSASDAVFENRSFDQVLRLQDFTLVHYVVEWSGQAQRFHASWVDLSQQLADKPLTDGAGESRKVQPVQLNCKQFTSRCKEHQISMFPALVLYKADGSFIAFDGEWQTNHVHSWVEGQLRSTGMWGRGRREVGPIQGCNVKGYVVSPRVPGHLRFTVARSDLDYDPAMANTSHRIKHFSFSQPDPNFMPSSIASGLPEEAVVDLAPLDGMDFWHDQAVEVYEHHLRPVSLVAYWKVAYPFVHFHRKMPSQSPPQVRFFFDMDPFAIEVDYLEIAWYDVVTSLLATVGGMFIFARLVTRTWLFWSLLVGPARCEDILPP